MRFTTWLKKQEERNDWIGDLAHDAVRDKTWPKQATKYQQFNSYLRQEHACEEALLAFHEAWLEFCGRLPFECPGDKCDEPDCAEGGCQAVWFMLHGYKPYVKCNGRAKQDRVTLALRFTILKRDGFACCLCGQGKQEGKKLEVDHKIPVADHGETTEDNLWTLCFECNRGKGTRLIQ